MDKYVGEAERNIRDLFVAAEEEWEAKGAESELHVVTIIQHPIIPSIPSRSTGSRHRTCSIVSITYTTHPIYVSPQHIIITSLTLILRHSYLVLTPWSCTGHFR